MAADIDKLAQEIAVAIVVRNAVAGLPLESAVAALMVVVTSVLAETNDPAPYWDKIVAGAEVYRQAAHDVRGDHPPASELH